VTFTITIADLWWVLPTVMTILSWAVAIIWFRWEMSDSRWFIPWFINPFWWFAALLASVVSLGSWTIYLLMHG
jgi:hypothetical protein